MLNPAQRDITVWRGGTFATRMKFFASTEPLEEMDLSLYDVSIVIEDDITLTEGNGITVTTNEIFIELTPEQTTATVNSSRAHYYIKFVKGAEVLFPVRGNMSFVSP